jgi:hypothetical protein
MFNIFGFLSRKNTSTDDYSKIAKGVVGVAGLYKQTIEQQFPSETETIKQANRLANEILIGIFDYCFRTKNLDFAKQLREILPFTAYLDNLPSSYDALPTHHKEYFLIETIDFLHKSFYF